MADDLPPCTLGPPTAVSTCYCTNRPGCPFDGDDDPECECGDPACFGCWDDEDGPEPWADGVVVGGVMRDVETVDTGGLL